MSKKTQRFSNFDVFAITRELNELLQDGNISNIYEVEDLLLIKINSTSGIKKLIIKSDSRINLTDYEYPIPQFPSQYIMSLRKFLKNRRIIEISQYNFDRIIMIRLSDYENNSWCLIIELFNKGNYILLNSENLVKVAKKYKKFRDRDILANREYEFPQSYGLDFLTLGFQDFKDIFTEHDVEIVRQLARKVNIAGLYSEEICSRAGLDKKIKTNELTEENIETLFKAFKELRNQLLFGKFSPQIILDEDENELNVVPFTLEIFDGYEKRDFESFNKAVDSYYSKLDSEEIISPGDAKIKKQIKAQEKILKNQQDYLEDLKRKKEKYYEHGEFIYSHFNELEKLISVIQDARKKKYDWKEINERMNQAKSKEMDGARFFEKLIGSRKQILIKINDDNVVLNLNQSLGENANRIYQKGKKAGKKIKGTIPAIEKTKKKIKKLETEQASLEMELDFLVKKPKKKWYEKYRWFQSSDGFLVIGGRDASSNEAIFKKYVEPNDIIFHTTFPGSPLAVVKNPDGLTIPETTLNEAAQFVASYSRAWKENWGVVDVFFVDPDQVSKTPPTGEYLPKGSFMISGKKEFIRNAKTELAISIVFEKVECNQDELDYIEYPKLIYGPKAAIKKKSSNIILIRPDKSGLSKGKLAKKIKLKFLEESNPEMNKWIKLLSVDDIILVLPSGNSKIR